MKPSKNLKLIQLLFVVTLVVLTNRVTAQPNSAPACPARPITVGVYEFGKFYHAGAGLDPDIVQQLEVRSGCKFSLQPMMREAIWPALQAGTLDMTLSAVASPGRLTFAWAAPYVWLKNFVILNSHVNANIKSTSDFFATPNLRLGVVLGYDYMGAYSDFVAQLRTVGRVDETNNADQQFAMLDKDRFQAVLATVMVYPTYVKAGNFRVEDWAEDNPRFSSNLLIGKKNFSEAEAKKWADVLNSMASDGTLRHLLEKYVQPDEADRMLHAGKSHP